MRDTLIKRLVEEDIDIDDLMIGKSEHYGSYHLQILRRSITNFDTVWVIISLSVDSEDMQYFNVILKAYGDRNKFSELSEEEQISFKLRFC